MSLGEPRIDRFEVGIGFRFFGASIGEQDEVGALATGRKADEDGGGVDARAV